MIGKRQINKLAIISLFMLMIFLSMTINCYAGESGIRLEIDDSNLESGVSTNLSIVFENLDGAKLEKIEGIEKFDVLSSGQSSSTTIINGDKNKSITINMSILPKEIGDLNLTGYVKYDGETLITNTVTLHVTKRNDSSGSNGEGDSQKDIYVKTNISKESTYFGEKIILSYELYSAYNIENCGIVDDFTLDGFISEDIPNEQLKSKIVSINGKNYIRAEIKKVILTPASVGELIIPSFRVQVNLQGQDLFSSGKTVYIDTDEKTLDVKQLPIDNKPKDFSGMIGKPIINTQYDKEVTDFNDSITLKIDLAGNCNLDILDTIYPKDRDDINIYETTGDLKQGVKDNDYYAEKSFEVIMVPQKTGEIILEPLSINYFDVETEEYKELIIDGKTITVTGDMASDNMNENNTSGFNPNNQGDISNQNQSIIINQIQPSAADKDYFIIKKSYVYILLVIILILIFLLLIHFIIRKRKAKDDKHLRDLYRSMKNAKHNHTRYEALNEIIKYRYNISLKSISKSELENYIDDKDLLKDALSIIDIMEESYQSKS